MDGLYSVWESIVGAIGDFDWPFWGAWSLTIGLLILGMIGSVVPLLPGPAILFVAGVLHGFLRPESSMSWGGIAILALLLVVAYVIDFVSGMLGARWFGATRWGVAGVMVGGIVGLFFGLPGLILGPLVGGFGFEILFARQAIQPAVKSTWGTILGTGVGLVVRVLISGLMVGVFFLDALWW